MLSNAPSVWYLSFYCDPRIKEIVVCKILMEARVHPLVLHIMETKDANKGAQTFSFFFCYSERVKCKIFG